MSAGGLPGEDETSLQNMLVGESEAVLQDLAIGAITLDTAYDELELIAAKEEALAETVLPCVEARERSIQTVRAEVETAYLETNGDALRDLVSRSRSDLNSLLRQLDAWSNVDAP
jgi:hypothetical protein